MVRGCQRKIIYLKNTRSEIFDEAYFIIKNDLKHEDAPERDMIEEANRILEESFFIGERVTKGGKLLGVIKKNAAALVIGVFIGVLITLLIVNL